MTAAVAVVKATQVVDAEMEVTEVVVVLVVVVLLQLLLLLFLEKRLNGFDQAENARPASY